MIRCVCAPSPTHAAQNSPPGKQHPQSRSVSPLLNADMDPSLIKCINCEYYLHRECVGVRDIHDDDYTCLYCMDESPEFLHTRRRKRQCSNQTYYTDEPIIIQPADKPPAKKCMRTVSSISELPLEQVTLLLDMEELSVFNTWMNSDNSQKLDLMKEGMWKLKHVNGEDIDVLQTMMKAYETKQQD